MSDLSYPHSQELRGPPFDHAGNAPGMPGPSNLQLSPPPLSTDHYSSGMDASGIAGGIGSPVSAGGSIRRAAPEPNKRALYVGGLDPRVTEELLCQIFETTGRVLNVKIIPDKNYTKQGFNYGFVEYEDPEAAERAMATLNGRKVLGPEIRVNWAYQSNSQNKEDTTNHFHLFIGDLSNEVTDEVLQQAFGPFGTVSEARVMWDMKTGRSRGYGFVAFPEKAAAEKALATMNGEWLGSRSIRVNWANQKGQPSISQQQAMAQLGMTPDGMTPAAYVLSPLDARNINPSVVPGAAPENPDIPPAAIPVHAPPGTASGSHTGNNPMVAYGPAPGLVYGVGNAHGHHRFPVQGIQSLDMVLSQTPNWMTTVYVGNITPFTTAQDLVPLFQNFGYVIETRFQHDRGFAFVKMDTHENAAQAICQLSGYHVNGRAMKTSWGKDKNINGGTQHGTQGRAPAPMYSTHPGPYYPQHGGNGGPVHFNPVAAGPMTGSPMSPQGPHPQYVQNTQGYAAPYAGAGYGGQGYGGHGGHGYGGPGGNGAGSIHHAAHEPGAPYPSSGLTYRGHPGQNHYHNQPTRGYYHG